jgi:flagellar L-ring protein precursor FlgH
MPSLLTLIVVLTLAATSAPGKDAPRESNLDRIIREASTAQSQSVTPGSVWSPGSSFNYLAADLRPRQVNDLVTIVVVDRASALARGTVKSARAASARGGVQSIFGAPPGGDRLRNVVGLSGESSLDGTGETSRETVLQTTLSARVTHVLPNGLLVVEGHKAVRVNSEMQNVIVRGLIRPVDVAPTNSIYSDQLAELEIAIDGKGVVGDAIRRPNLLYRILLGILPF